MLNFLLVVLAALTISMAVIPLMMRLAPRLGMVDLPDPRKVHTAPIPRVGGLGIIVGALASLALWSPIGAVTATYVFGSLVLLVFGALDDSHELGHYVKFIGQFIAAIAVVYFGGLWVSSMPFGYVLPEQIGKPFTVVAIVGMINAINHSDGLDGLAAGESLLSLGCLVYLAQLANNFFVLILAIAVIGGVFGFLRFNTHPAKVFMGDAGSQFIGFSLGVLTVALTQGEHPGFSMALPALILGLPVIDIIAVFVLRMYHGMNWFRATKNHVHHRLLGIGYDHYQAVVIIYSIQAFLVAGALSLKFSSDWAILGLYAAVCGTLFVVLLRAERTGWKANEPNQASKLATFIQVLKSRHVLDRWPMLFVNIAIPTYFVASALCVSRVTPDFAFTAILIVVLLLFAYLLRKTYLSSYLARVAVYALAASLVYLVETRSDGLAGDYGALRIGFFVLLAAATGLAVRYMRDIEFDTTPTDYLLIFLVVAASIFAQEALQIPYLGGLVAATAILFYGCELILTRQRRVWSTLLNTAAIASATLLLITWAGFL